jgi:poly-gamma-glutamate synthesis protein (capsule biosynthesis protein)
MFYKKIIIPILVIIIFSSSIYILYKNNNVNNNSLEDISTTTKSVNKVKEINFTFVGDLLFESPFYNAVSNGYDKNTYFNRVKKYFLDDDISVGNMEVVIGNNKLTVSGDGYNFCAPSYIGDLVNTLDFQVLSTANNHTYDRNLDGIYSTIDYFNNNTNILTVGTYKDNVDRNTSRIIDVDGVKVGFLAYTYGTNIKIEDNNRSKVGLYKDPDTKEINKELLKTEISNLKNNVDIIVVIMHWGTEFTFEENEEQVSLAEYLNELGVDIILGSHSHSIQPIDIIGDNHKTLVYYSMGNFTSNDDDIARTPKGQETFDNAYQFGLLSKVTLTYDDKNIDFKSINTIPIVNYFDKNMNNFELIPFDEYNETYERKHYRYNLGLTRNFIETTFNNVIDEKYR